ncbi:MAG: SDR family oxidoreductase [Candidatus Kariarchaeaceae archaeon]|jgi:NAD(P)-dependent dehydrogenase (short-subunit alcohol dehydrogenase family)
MPKTLKCDPELFKKDLSGQVHIVTGANSGSGLETAKQLARQGAKVIAACRRVEAGNKAFTKFTDISGHVEVMELDLSSFSSIRKFAEDFLSKYDRLDGLTNNAGIMACPESKTEDGFETQFGVNYLGHFLLTELLLDILKKSTPARVVCVSSVAHAGMRGQPAEIHLDDLNFEKRSYHRVLAYNQSKLANVLHALNLSERLEGTSVSVFSVHPGWIRSNLAKHAGPGAVFIQNVLMRPFARFLGTMSPWDGAQTSLHCLLDDDAPNHSGEFYSQNSILYANKEDRPGGWPMRSPNPLSHDIELAKKLYEISRGLVGLSDN